MVTALRTRLPISDRKSTICDLPQAADKAKTGQGAWRITRSVVLPRSASNTP
jgi:hypothetical protein